MVSWLSGNYASFDHVSHFSDLSNFSMGVYTVQDSVGVKDHTFALK